MLHKISFRISGPLSLCVLWFSLKNRMNSSVYSSPTTENEIESIIKDFKNDKARDISIYILKKCASHISRKLSTFFNNFMEKGTFPEVLKTGKIIPIYKKDDPKNLATIDLFLFYRYLIKFLKRLSIVNCIDPLSEGLVTPPLRVEKLSPRLNFFDNIFSCIT